DGTVKLLDFGIAKAANQVEQTRSGELKGKLSYMSPEQCYGKPLDCRSDIFSVGVVLYEWLTGFKLFTGESEVAVMRSITEGKIYAPSYFKADIPEPVEAILMKALEKDRDRRYQSAGEMRAAIDAFLNTYEFTPTPLHLSNFLRQLFHDELNEEQGRLKQTTSSDEVLAVVEEEVTPVASSPGKAFEEESPSERSLNLTLPGEQVEALEAIAQKSGVSMSKIVGELLAVWLKYR
ncbi:MAG TPA: serine/threonine-protein kinase, partial [Hyalangium sp.]|nr:serine/threonine-protein kinase [Hyalangium sp.]